MKKEEFLQIKKNLNPAGSDAGQNHQKGGFLHFGRINLSGQRLEIVRSFVNEFVPSDLDLDESVGSDSQMDDGVAFESVLSR